jgi:nucleolar protein 12
LKALIRHLISTVPLDRQVKIESTRFRSIAFNKPTKAIKSGDGSSPDLTLANAGSDEETPEKTYYSTAQKKRLAYLRRETNDKADVVNCYVVIAHPRPPKDGEAQTAPAPSEAARLLVEGADGTSFMGRTIRVDRVGATKAALEMAKGGEKKHDMKRTLFIGSLDFEAKEQDLRDLLEELLQVERGDPPTSTSLQEGVAPSILKHNWVQSVRIVRDADSQLGKGIAYVQFRVSCPCPRLLQDYIHPCR